MGDYFSTVRNHVFSVGSGTNNLYSITLGLSSEYWNGEDAVSNAVGG